MSVLVQDLRSAFRGLRKSKGTTVIVLVTLTLGMATVTTIFSFVNSALFRPPPYPDAGRMAAVSEERRGASSAFSELSLESARELRSVRSFERLGVYRLRSVSVVDPTRAVQIQATMADTALLPMLGIQPIRGRLPSASEITRSDPVVLIGEGFWHKWFGASEAILGQTITIEGVPHSIVGVAPAEFGFPERSQLWVPLSAHARSTVLDEQTFSALAMLDRETSIGQARAEVDVIGRRLAASGHAHLQGVSLVVRDGMVDRRYRPVIAPLALTFLGAAICVLLIACTNVGNLMLARAVERRTEMAIRTALGASRSRLIRHSLTESVVVGLAAGALGLLLTFWALPVVTRGVPLAGMPSWIRLGIDLRVLGFTFALSLVTVMAFGLSPAIAGSRLDTMSVLKSGGLWFSGGLRATRAARRGVVVELALSVVLLTGAILLWQTYRNLQMVDPGFDAERVLLTRIAYDDARYPDIGARMQLLADVETRLSTHPGVEGVAIRGRFAGMLTSTAVPTMPKSPSSTPNRPDRGMYLPENPGIAVNARPAPEIWNSVVSDDYFRMLGIPLTRGRNFGSSDGPGSQPVAIVSEQLVRGLWRGEEALGKQFRIGKDGAAFTVIGVARDVRFTTSDRLGLDAGPKRSVYYSARQVDGGSPELIVRARGEPELLTLPISAAIRSSDPTVATLSAPETLAADAQDAMLGTRVAGGFMGIFALVALVLATIGIYGVLAYGVADRTRELGIRIALGGTSRDVIGLVVRDGMRFVGIGLVIGVSLTLIGTPLLRRFVWGVSVSDPRVFVLVVATFGVVALLACWIPARRATRVEPMVALRQN